GAVGGILLRRRVAQPDLVLVVEPDLVERPPACVDHPAHEAWLDRRLVVIVRLPVGTEEPARQLLMAADDLPPFVDQAFRLVLEDIAGLIERAAVIVREAGGFLQALEVVEGEGRAPDLAIIIAGDVRIEHERAPCRSYGVAFEGEPRPGPVRSKTS